MIGAYKDYFRDCAIRHKKIKHDPASEGNGGVVAKRKFESFNMDEVAKSLRSSVGDGIVLFLHMYDWSPEDNGAFDTKAVYTGGFMVTMKAAVNNSGSEEIAYVETEQVAWDIIGKMYGDFQTSEEKCMNALGMVNWNSIKVTSTGQLWDNRFGWWVEFNFTKSVNHLLSEDSVTNAFD